MTSETKAKHLLLKMIRLFPLVLCITFMAIYLFSGRDISLDTLLNLAPEDSILAAVFLIAMYALKSVTIFFPIIILNFTGGFLFPTHIALLVNAIGLLVDLTIPYWIGRLSGSSFADKLCKKYPRLNEIIRHQQNNEFFMTFFLRVISCLPSDAVSMYFGASKTPFWMFLCGSFMGAIPGIFSATLLGTSITEPDSPMFWISLSLTVGLSAISFLIYFLWRKRQKRGENR